MGARTVQKHLAASFARQRLCRPGNAQSQPEGVHIVLRVQDWALVPAKRPQPRVVALAIRQVAQPAQARHIQPVAHALAYVSNPAPIQRAKYEPLDLYAARAVGCVRVLVVGVLVVREQPHACPRAARPPAPLARKLLGVLLCEQ
eukprot:9632174-Lingulodinium_polyedra.AAC.1